MNAPAMGISGGRLRHPSHSDSTHRIPFVARTTVKHLENKRVFLLLGLFIFGTLYGIWLRYVKMTRDEESLRGLGTGLHLKVAHPPAGSRGMTRAAQSRASAPFAVS